MKTSLPLALALSALATAAAAQTSQVSLTGVVDLGARYVDNSKGSLKSLSSGNNGTSRFVLRGQEDLGDGLRAGFWLESSFAADTGVSLGGTQFWDRQATVNLTGRFGELRMGRDWTPAFNAFALTDPFIYVSVAGAGSMLSASATTAMTRAFGAGASTISRVSNAVEYWLPKDLGGVYGQFMLAPGEGGNAQGSFRYTGARLGLKRGKFDIAAYGALTRIDAAGEDFRQFGVSAWYDFGVFKLQGSVIDTKFLSSKQTNYMLGAVVPVGAGFVNLTYNRADQRGTNAAGASIDPNDGQLFGVGYVYFLSKRTALYATAAHISNKGRANFSVPGGPAGIAPGSGSSGYEAGLRHSF